MVQVCTLLSIKTGGCPEDCGYCSQSIHSKNPIEAKPYDVIGRSKKNKQNLLKTKVLQDFVWGQHGEDQVIKILIEL